MTAWFGKLQQIAQDNTQQQISSAQLQEWVKQGLEAAQILENERNELIETLRATETRLQDSEDQVAELLKQIDRYTSIIF